MNSKFLDYFKEARLRFHDDVVKPKADATKKPTSLPFMKDFITLPASTVGTPAKKDTMTGYLFSGHFIDQAIDRDLTEDEFKHIYKGIRDSEGVWKKEAKTDDQRYMFFSKSKRRAFIVRLFNNRVSVITCLPKGKDGNDDYKETIKKLLENTKKCDIITIEVE